MTRRMTNLLTTTEAAAIVGMHPNAFVRSMRDTYGVEPACKIGNAHAWRRTDVKAVAAKHAAKSSAKAPVRPNRAFTATTQSGGKREKQNKRRRDLRRAIAEIKRKKA